MWTTDWTQSNWFSISEDKGWVSLIIGMFLHEVISKEARKCCALWKWYKNVKVFSKAINIEFWSSSDHSIHMESLEYDFIL